MLVFFVQRCLFLFCSKRSLEDVAWADVLYCHLPALWMDVSTVGYLLLVTTLLAAPLLFTSATWPVGGIIWFTTAALIASAVLNISDIGLFAAWGAKLDRKALGYLAFPREAIAGVPLPQLLGLLALGAAQVWLLRRWMPRFHPATDVRTTRLGRRMSSAVLAPILCFIAARGGPQDDPINKSWAYHSRHAVLNLAALNSVWNALEIAVEPANVATNPYVSMPQEEAERMFRIGHSTSGNAPTPLLRVKKPNILIVLLESWTADVIAPLGGDTNVAPAFSRLAKDGLLFSNFYSTGFRTEQGLCALISGFPAQPKTTIMRNYGKFDRLPSMVKALGKDGYRSTYWYAGNIDFANTRAYLDAMGFDNILDRRAFIDAPATEWGALDEALFNYHLEHADLEPEPFFHVVMTSTSHEPFDAPVPDIFHGRDQPTLYRNTVHYTDSCLGAFIHSARTAPWYDSTLIVVVADHGHYLPRYRDAAAPERHRIPFLLLGGALRDDLRGTTNTVFASHVDVPRLLLRQLGMDPRGFEWGRDPLDISVHHDAFWTFNEGFGIADSTQAIVYDEVGDRITYLRDSSASTAANEQLLREGKARIQVLLERYIGFNQ